VVLAFLQMQRALILAVPLLEVGHTRAKGSHFRFGRAEARLYGVQLLGDVEPRLGLRRELGRELTVFCVQAVERTLALAGLGVSLVEVLACAPELVLEAVDVALEPVDLKLERKARRCRALARLAVLALNIVQCVLDRDKVGLTLGEQRLCACEVFERGLQCRLLPFESASLAPDRVVVIPVGLVEFLFDALAFLPLVLELLGEFFDVRRQLFLASTVFVNLSCGVRELLGDIIQLRIEVAAFL
jgi:hypothetical protein